MRTDRAMQWQAWGIAVLRVVVGTVFLAHGGQKIFAYGFPAMSGMMANLGIPAPALFGVLVPLVEFLGGAAVLLGLFTRWAASLLAITMLVAVVAVHLKGGFFLPTGFEYALTLLAANLTLILCGPGAAALETVLFPSKRAVTNGGILDRT